MIRCIMKECGMIHTSYNIWAACLSSSESHHEPHIWHLIHKAPRSQQHTHPARAPPPTLPDPPTFTQFSPFTVFPLFSCLSVPLSLSVCMLGEQRLIAGGKYSTLVAWPSSGRVIHPYPFTSPTSIHCALFPFSPHTSSKTIPYRAVLRHGDHIWRQSFRKRCKTLPQGRRSR